MSNTVLQVQKYSIRTIRLVWMLRRATDVSQDQSPASHHAAEVDYILQLARSALYLQCKAKDPNVKHLSTVYI